MLGHFHIGFWLGVCARCNYWICDNAFVLLFHLYSFELFLTICSSHELWSSWYHLLWTWNVQFGSLGFVSAPTRLYSIDFDQNQVIFNLGVGVRVPGVPYFEKYFFLFCLYWIEITSKCHLISQYINGFQLHRTLN